jgi:aspartate kinase
MIIMKFGGSSVANREQIHKVFDIVRSRIDRAPLVVSSAHKGITDMLVNAARTTASGTIELAPIDRQRQIAAELGCAPELLEPFYDELHGLLRGISLVKELSPRSLDYVSSFGERMAVRVIADYFTRQGLPTRAYDVWELGFITDSKFGSARPIDGWEQTCCELVAKLPKGELPLVTGFVGKNAAGEITTVGRNGSDLTASLLGAALRVDEVQIWTDPDGVMTAHPSVVREACNIPYMRFDEAAELAYFGSRVLHPSTLLPAMRSEIPVRVLNTNRPEHRGTVIEKTTDENPNAATSIAYKERQSVLVLRTTRMFGQSGFLASVFEILGRRGVDVDVITTSEVSISLTSANRAELEAAADELRAFGEVELQHGKTILVVVGQHMPERPGLGAKILHSIAETGVNVEMVSYGLDSINFTMVIDDADIGKAVKALHPMLFGG